MQFDSHAGNERINFPIVVPIVVPVVPIVVPDHSILYSIIVN